MLQQRRGMGLARVAALRRAAPAQSAARRAHHDQDPSAYTTVVLSASNADYIFAWQPEYGSKYGAQLCQMSKTRQK